MKYLKLLLPILTILTFLTCNKEEITPDLSDCWEEIEPEEVLQFAGSSHTFCFLNDTDFTITILRWTDQIPGPDCETIPEYIKGTYQRIDDSLEMEGTYMESDFSTPGTSCDGATDYVRIFTMKTKWCKRLVFNGLEEGVLVF